MKEIGNADASHFTFHGAIHLKRRINFQRSFVVVLGFLLFCQPGIGAPIELVLLKEVEVDAATIHLGDIAAEIKGVDDAKKLKTLKLLRLRRAPLPGRPSATLDATSIRTYLRSARFPLKEVGLEPDLFKIDNSAQVVVKRKSSHVRVEKVIQFARQFLREELQQRFNGEYQIQSEASISDFHLPYGQVEFSARPLRAQFLSGRVSIYVDISIDGQKKKTVILPFDVALTVDVAISLRKIDRHQAITADDVRIEKRALNQVRIPPLRLEDLQGVRANRRIRAGTMLTAEIVGPLPKILRESIVTIMVELNGVSVRTTGVALSDGYVGKKLKVINQRSQKPLVGTVTEDGAVQVVVQR